MIVKKHLRIPRRFKVISSSQISQGWLKIRDHVCGDLRGRRHRYRRPILGHEGPPFSDLTHRVTDLLDRIRAADPKPIIVSAWFFKLDDHHGRGSVSSRHKYVVVERDIYDPVTGCAATSMKRPIA